MRRIALYVIDTLMAVALAFAAAYFIVTDDPFTSWES